MWMFVFLISLPGATLDCSLHGDSIQDEVACWRQSHDIWMGILAETLDHMVELSLMVETLAQIMLVDGHSGSLPHSTTDFGQFQIAVPTGWIVEVTGQKPWLAGMIVPAGVASEELWNVSTLVMTHPATDEYPTPLTITVTTAPRMGSLSQHTIWEDGILQLILPHLGKEYGGVADWEDLGSVRIDSDVYLREGGLEINDMMVYRSATYLIFDDDDAYYVGLSAPPHVFDLYKDLWDKTYDTFTIN